MWSPSVQTQSQMFVDSKMGYCRVFFVCLFLHGQISNGGLGEGDSQVLVASHVVVVKVDQGLYGLLDCWHLDKSHFTIPEKEKGGGVRQQLEAVLQDELNISSCCRVSICDFY